MQWGFTFDNLTGLRVNARLLGGGRWLLEYMIPFPGAALVAPRVSWYAPGSTAHPGTCHH